MLQAVAWFVGILVLLACFWLVARWFYGPSSPGLPAQLSGVLGAAIGLMIVFRDHHMAYHVVVGSVILIFSVIAIVVGERQQRQYFRRFVSILRSIFG